MPVMIKGLKVHPDNPLLFDFILDTGNSKLQINGTEFKAESQKLIKYFLAALTIREEDLWVNLSPYEKNRMIPQELGKTVMGQDMLAEDYILKQLTASLIYPEKSLGKKFWDNIYTKARQTYGVTDIPVNSFNKVWIVADKAKVLEHNNAAFVVGAHLKVMLEEDYLALIKHKNGSPTKTFGDDNQGHNIASNIIRQIILPQLEREVNQGQNFATLRQMFYSMILASWYKLELKNALLNQVYSNKAKTSGVLTGDPAIKDKIYQQYLKAYKKGVFNYIKEDLVEKSQQSIPRKYFSGGENFAMLADVQIESQLSPGDTPLISNGSMAMAYVQMARQNALDISKGNTNAAMTADSDYPRDFPEDIAKRVRYLMGEEISPSSTTDEDLRYLFSQLNLSSRLLAALEALTEIVSSSIFIGYNERVMIIKKLVDGSLIKPAVTATAIQESLINLAKLRKSHVPDIIWETIEPLLYKSIIENNQLPSEYHIHLLEVLANNSGLEESTINMILGFIVNTMRLGVDEVWWESNGYQELPQDVLKRLAANSQKENAIWLKGFLVKITEDAESSGYIRAQAVEIMGHLLLNPNIDVLTRNEVLNFLIQTRDKKLKRGSFQLVRQGALNAIGYAVSQREDIGLEGWNAIIDSINSNIEPSIDGRVTAIITVCYLLAHDRGTYNDTWERALGTLLSILKDHLPSEVEAAASKALAVAASQNVRVVRVLIKRHYGDLNTQTIIENILINTMTQEGITDDSLEIIALFFKDIVLNTLRTIAGRKGLWSPPEAISKAIRALFQISTTSAAVNVNTVQDQLSVAVKINTIQKQLVESIKQLLEDNKRSLFIRKIFSEYPRLDALVNLFKNSEEQIIVNGLKNYYSTTTDSAMGIALSKDVELLAQKLKINLNDQAREALIDLNKGSFSIEPKIVLHVAGLLRNHLVSADALLRLIEDKEILRSKYQGRLRYPDKFTKNPRKGQIVLEGHDDDGVGLATLGLGTKPLSIPYRVELSPSNFIRMLKDIFILRQGPIVIRQFIREIEKEINLETNPAGEAVTAGPSLKKILFIKFSTHLDKPNGKLFSITELRNIIDSFRLSSPNVKIRVHLEDSHYYEFIITIGDKTKFDLRIHNSSAFGDSVEITKGVKSFRYSSFENLDLEKKTPEEIASIVLNVAEEVLKIKKLPESIQVSDLAMTPASITNGGIDMTGSKMSMDIANEGKDIQMNLDPAMVAEFRKGNFTGIEGIIIRIVPIDSPLSILGF